MKTLRHRARASVLGATTAWLLCACAVTGVGVEGSVGYDAGYYAPYGYDYGDWGVGYVVGPSRCCGGRRDEHRDHPIQSRPAHRPAYRPAPAGRAAPSIPSRSRTH
jgi:hypothetical protein